MGSAFREKFMLCAVLVASFLFCATANRCYRGDDPNRCDTLVERKFSCFLIQKLVGLGNCQKKGKFCIEQKKVCWQPSPICSRQCCSGWKEDKFNKCSISIKSDSKSSKKHLNVPTVITGILVAILIVILVIISVCMFRFKKARRTSNLIFNRRTDSTNANGQSSIYTIYENEPPPYDIVIQSKLPAYSETDQSPHAYENTNFCAAAGRTEESQSSHVKSNAVNNERGAQLVCTNEQTASGSTICQ